jgi:organic radical activating enzyme
MLDGIWPGQGCEFCKEVEDVGGISDRMMQTKIPNYPTELYVDKTATITTPTTVEVFFDNKCNLSCVYCCSRNSSKIQAENKKYGTIQLKNVPDTKNSVKDVNYEENKHLFWKWMEQNSTNVENFNILGGEPFIQDDFNTTLDFFKNTPSPNLTIVIVSNLTILPRKFNAYILQLKELVLNKQIRAVHVVSSIDAWGPEEEFVRYGINLNMFDENINSMLDQDDWLSVSINQTITSLTINGMPMLIDKINEWRKKKDIGHYGGKVIEHDHLNPIHFGPDFWNETLDLVISKMQNKTYNEQQAVNIIKSEQLRFNSSTGVNVEMKQELFLYLDEIDKRRNTNWRNVFPYLTKESINNVV